MPKFINYILLTAFLTTFSSCLSFSYIYYERDKAEIKGIDMACTLNIAEIKLKHGEFDSILTIWAIRDQVITPAQAERINNMYFNYIKTSKSEFGIWHIAWAISNFYRLGNDEIKNKLKPAYEDAIKKPDTLENFKSTANELINSKKIYMGYIHNLARSYALKHIVVPGNKEYLQSMDDFIKNSKSNKELLKLINEHDWAKKCIKEINK